MLFSILTYVPAGLLRSWMWNIRLILSLSRLIVSAQELARWDALREQQLALTPERPAATGPLADDAPTTAEAVAAAQAEAHQQVTLQVRKGHKKSIRQQSVKNSSTCHLGGGCTSRSHCRYVESF